MGNIGTANYSGVIIIDEDAARLDINNLESAKGKLNDAMAAVNKLMSITAQMQSNTGSAIQEKSRQIAVKLNDLMTNLSNAQKAINAAIEEKQAQDMRAEQINRSGGI